MLRDAKPAIKSIVKSKQQTLTSVCLEVVEHLRDRVLPGKLTQSGANAGGTGEMVNIGHWRNRITNHVHSIGGAMQRVKRRNLGSDARALYVEDGIRRQQGRKVFEEGNRLLQILDDSLERRVEVNARASPGHHSPELVFQFFSVGGWHGTTAAMAARRGRPNWDLRHRCRAGR